MWSKNLIQQFFILNFCATLQLSGQPQLLVLGNNSEGATATIQTTATLGELIGVEVNATSSTTSVAGNFIGSSIGILANGITETGVFGSSETGLGVVGTSGTSYGGVFQCGDKSKPDLVLGGNSASHHGVLSSDPAHTDSDLLLQAYRSIKLDLDYDNDEPAMMQINAGSGTEVFSIDERGNAKITSTNNTNANLHILDNEASDFARIRLQNPDNIEFWDIAGGGTNNSELNFLPEWGSG